MNGEVMKWKDWDEKNWPGQADNYLEIVPMYVYGHWF